MRPVSKVSRPMSPTASEIWRTGSVEVNWPSHIPTHGRRPTVHHRVAITGKTWVVSSAFVRAPSVDFGRLTRHDSHGLAERNVPLELCTCTCQPPKIFAAPVQTNRSRPRCGACESLPRQAKTHATQAVKTAWGGTHQALCRWAFASQASQSDSAHAHFLRRGYV